VLEVVRAFLLYLRALMMLCELPSRLPRGGFAFQVPGFASGISLAPTNSASTLAAAAAWSSNITGNDRNWTSPPAEMWETLKTGSSPHLSR
jgi:hypothetical protein